MKSLRLTVPTIAVMLVVAGCGSSAQPTPLQPITHTAVLPTVPPVSLPADKPTPTVPVPNPQPYKAFPAPCPDGTLEGRYTFVQMQSFANCAVALVSNFITASYKRMPPPAAVYYIAQGKIGNEPCIDETGAPGTFNDVSYEYCPVDNKIYIGQAELWEFYHGIGDAAPIVGLAHEWGHLIQTQTGVPAPTDNVESVNHENQADCVAGAFVAYVGAKNWLEYPADVGDIAGLLQEIASAETASRTHGTLEERSKSLSMGIKGGLFACNSFYPETHIYNG